MEDHVCTSGDGAPREYEFALGDELRGERATLGKTLLDVQRDLRIQATYISAIEDGDVSAFPNPSFIPGYIRSYARYLGLDPVEVYRRFCSEHGFSQAQHGQQRVSEAVAATPGPAAAAKALPFRRAAAPSSAAAFQPRFPLSEPKTSAFSGFSLSALGSLAVLLLLTAGLGYGGWTMLQNIQRVQFAPVEDLPAAQSELAIMEAPVIADEADGAFAELAKPVAAASLADLYRQQEIEVPILEPRDGPIAAIDPDHLAPLLLNLPEPEQPKATSAVSEAPIVVAPLIQAFYAQGQAAEGAATEVSLAGGADTEPKSVLLQDAASMPVSLVAGRAAWVRVYLENGTIIFERILEKGESYALPRGADAPLVWAGNAGSVYVRAGDALHGPLGTGTQAVKDVSLDPELITARYPLVRDAPSVIGQRMDAPVPAVGAVAIQ